LLLAVLDAYRSGIRRTLLKPAWKGVADPIEKVFALLLRYRNQILETECLYGCPIGSLGAGFSAGLCWVAASFGINYVFERKSFALFLINGGYHTAQFTLYGLVLGLWH
jgi:hypothetical protein